MASPIISLKATTGLFNNQSNNRNQNNIPKDTIFIDMTELIQNKSSTTGLIQLKDDGLVTASFGVEDEDNSSNTSSIILKNKHNSNTLFNIPNPMDSVFNPLSRLSSTLFDLFLQSTLSEVAGKVNLKKGVGLTLSQKLFNNARDFQDTFQTQDQDQEGVITREQIAQSSTAMLVHELKSIVTSNTSFNNNNNLQRNTILCLPPGEINPYNDQGDISTNKFMCETEKDQTHLNNRIVARDLLELISKEGSIHRETQKYTVEYQDGDSFVTQELAKPTQTLLCEERDVIIKAKKDSNSIGSYTEAKKDIIEEATNISSQPLILQKTVVNKEESSSLFSSSSKIEITNTFSALPSINRSGKDIIKRATNNINQISTQDVAKDVLKYDAPNIELSSLILTNTFSSTETSSNSMGITTKTSSLYQESPVMIVGQSSARQILFIGKKAKVFGIVIRGEEVIDQTEEGISLGPVIKEMSYRQEVTIDSPLSYINVGCCGGYQVMIPTMLLVERIIGIENRDNPMKCMKFENVDLDLNKKYNKNKDRVLVIGKFVETTRVLTQWQRTWSVSEQTIPTGAMIIISLAISYATMGVGATMTGFTGISGVMASAGFTTICNAAAMSFLSTGDPILATQSLLSNSFLKTLAINVATAGACSILGESLNGLGLGLDMNPSINNVDPSILDFLKASMVRTAINIPLRYLTSEESLGLDKIVVKEVAHGLIDTLAMSMAYNIGKIYRDGNNKMSFIDHKLIHALAGGVTGGLMAGVDKQDIMTGMIAGAIGSSLGEAFGELNPFNFEDVGARLTAAKMMAGTITMLIKGNDVTAINTAIHTASITVENNVLPCILAALQALGWTYVAKESLEAYEEEGFNAGVDTLIINGIVLRVTGTILHYGGKLYQGGKQFIRYLKGGKAYPSSPISKEMLQLKLRMQEEGKVIMGPGTKHKLWDIDRIIKQHGGKPEEWVKKTGEDFNSITGNKLSLHWLRIQ